MKLPCEVAVKSVVPAIRALLAKELTETYEMKQTEAANLLGITQTAVSKYTHHVRGRILQVGEEKEVTALIKKTAESLVNGDLDKTQLVLQICDTCKLVRKKGLMCELCKQANPTLHVRQCKLCLLSFCDASTIQFLEKSRKKLKRKRAE